MTRLWISRCAAVALTPLALGPSSAPLSRAPAGSPPSARANCSAPALSSARGAVPARPLPAAPETTGEVVVRFRDGVASERQAQLVGTSGCRIERRCLGYALVRVRAGRAGDLIRLLAERAEVARAEPCCRLRALAAPLYDPFQWYLFDRGTRSGAAVSDYGIQAASAWRYTRGAGVTVAVVDSGAAFEEYHGFHVAPALGQTPFADTYNALDGSAHPDDDNGHGTYVAGLLAGNMVNGGGSVGAAPGVTLMPVKVLGADGSGRDFDIADGIRWAADHGARVINLSLGGTDAGSVLAAACRYAASKESVLVAAAGNDAADQVEYPAAYTDCLAVGATAFDGTRAPYSNRGRKLDVVAPGGNMGVDENGDGAPDGLLAQTFEPRQGFGAFDYEFRAGTSMAAPLVSAVAALVRAVNPDFAALEVRLAIRNTARRLGGTVGRNNDTGYGLVDALAAVQAARAPAGP